MNKELLKGADTKIDNNGEFELKNDVACHDMASKLHEVVKLSNEINSVNMTTNFDDSVKQEISIAPSDEDSTLTDTGNNWKKVREEPQ